MTADQTMTKRQWMICTATLTCIKLLLLALDPLPMFFLGDSHTYLGTALTLSIPLDRSFVYGLFVRLAAVTTGSLFSLVLLQVFISSISAIILVFILVRFLGTRFRTALLLGVLCAVEPLQLLYERYVMTETLALFLFALYFLGICYYLENRSYLRLAVLQILGTALITIRLSFLPVVFCFAVVVPLLPLLPLLKSRPSRFATARVVSTHLAFSLVVTLACHSAYKHLNGFLVKGPAAYQYQSGLFLAADFAPVLSPVDFPDPRYAPAVFSGLVFDLKDRKARGRQRWMDGGLIARMNMVIPDLLETDKAAKTTAVNALKRDPLGIALLAVQGFSDYWNPDMLQPSLITDKGSDRALPPELLDALKINFGLDATTFPTAKTLTGTYFFAAWPWYLLLLCVPVLAAVAVIFNRVGRDKLLLVFIATSAVVLTASLLIERPTVRYLHPLGWLIFLIAGPLFNNVMHIFNRKELQR